MEFSLPKEVYAALPWTFWVREAWSQYVDFVCEEFTEWSRPQKWYFTLLQKLMVIVFSVILPAVPYLMRRDVINSDYKTICVESKKNQQILQITQLLYGTKDVE